MPIPFRFVAAVAVTATLATALTGCSSSSGDSGGGSSTDFSYWSFTGIGAKDDVTKYQTAHPGTTIKLTEVGSSVETAQALTTALAGGKVPDLVLIQGDDLPKFVANPGNFVDLKTLGAGDLEKDYLPWAWSQSVAAGGQVLGVPTDVGGMALSYRKDLFAAAGLPTDPAKVAALMPTWQDFINVGKQYTQKTGKPFVDNAETSIFYQAVNQVSEKYYTNDTKKVDYANAEVKAAFDVSVQAVQAGISANLASFSTAAAAGTAKGDFAVISTPSWMLQQLKTNAPATSGKWGLTSIPGNTGNWGGSYLAIPARAANKTAAWNYIKQMESPAAQLDHFVASGSLPTTPSVYTDPKLLGAKDKFFSDAPTGEIFTKSVTGIKPFYIGPDSGAIGTEFQNAIVNVENKKVAPDQAWPSALAAIKQSIGQ